MQWVLDLGFYLRFKLHCGKDTPSAPNMSTLYMAVTPLLRNSLAICWLLWITAFCVTRVYALHEAYVAEVGKREDERWLLDKCTDPEFYSNLRQHSNLCTEVGCNDMLFLCSVLF